MALVDNAWYVNYGDGATTGYYALTVWATGAVIAAGAIRRQLAAPAVGSERVFVCVVAGTTHATTEPTWVLTRGGKTTDNTVTWQECTGIAALNGDATNTPTWTITATPPGGVKNTAVTLGQVIARDSAASYQICTTAGTAGNGAEPAFSNTAGTTTSDNTVTWTSLGVVGNFTGWQAPHARLGNACTATWGQAGNTFWLASDQHAETQATSISFTVPATLATPSFIYSVNRSNVPPTSANLATGASINATGASNVTITTTSNTGNSYWYGVSINVGSGSASTVTASLTTMIMDTCPIALVSTGSVSSIRPSLSIWKNTTVSFASVGQQVVLSAFHEWYNTPSAILGSVPTTLFADLANGYCIVSGVDFSAMGSGKTLCANNSTQHRYVFSDCKLGASVAIVGSITAYAFIDLVACDSAATNYRNERYTAAGTQTVETTIIRTGGATDGTTVQSRKIVTTANSRWVFPFECQPITIWNTSTSAITTLTIYGTTTGGGVPNDDQIWAEVEYLGSSATPQGSFKTSTKATNLAASAATNNTSDASTWAGGGAGNGFKIVVPSFTPGMAGPIYITIKAAKASTTYYIDPLPSISGVTVTKSEILAPGVYANEISTAPISKLVSAQRGSPY